MKQVFYITSKELVVYHCEKGQVHEAGRFTSTDHGYETFETFLSCWSHCVSYLLVDVIEEEYRHDTIPHVSGGDRSAMIERKLRQAYRNTPYRCGQVIGRKNDGRRDDEVLFSALTNPHALSAWLKELQLYKVPIVGMYSVPLVSQGLMSALALKDPYALLVSLQDHAFLRQSFFNHRVFKASRLSPLSTIHEDSYSKGFVQELEKNQRYLRNLRLLPHTERLDIYILTTPEFAETHLSGLNNNEQMNFHFVELDYASQSIGLESAPDGNNCTPLFAQLITGKALPVNYLAKSERRFYSLYRIRKTLTACTAALSALAILWSGYNIIAANEIDDKTAEVQHNTIQLYERYQHEAGRLPLVSVSPAEMRDVVEVHTQLLAKRAKPEQLLARISQHVKAFPNIAIEHIDWQVIENVEEFSATNARATVHVAEHLIERGNEVIEIDAYLISSEATYIKAFDVVHAFIDALRSETLFVDVQATSMPIDAHPQSSLIGIAGSDDFVIEQAFSIRIVVEPIGKQTDV